MFATLIKREREIVFLLKKSSIPQLLSKIVASCRMVPSTRIAEKLNRTFLLMSNVSVASFIDKFFFYILFKNNKLNIILKFRWSSYSNYPSVWIPQRYCSSQRCWLLQGWTRQRWTSDRVYMRNWWMQWIQFPAAHFNRKLIRCSDFCYFPCIQDAIDCCWGWVVAIEKLPVYHKLIQSAFITDMR